MRGDRVVIVSADELADLDKAKRWYDEARQDARDAIAAKRALAQPGRAKWPWALRGPGPLPTKSEETKASRDALETLASAIVGKPVRRAKRKAKRKAKGRRR